MKRLSGVVLLLGTFLISAAQNDTDSASLEEVIIYSGKFAERKKNVAQKIDVITSRTIARINAQNSGDLLINTGKIFVQKSQQGGSSPVIRGFEASRVLLVVDGIRMNNAIYRAGHLQNIITVDQNMVERVEVLYGPASTVYGSDALGGVVHFRSKQPRLSTTSSLFTTGSAFARFSSANNEKTVHSDVSIGGQKFAWLQSYNYSDFGDMKMGSNYPDTVFGSRPRYVKRINGIDSVVFTKDSNVQRFSGYRQWDITQKFLYRQSARVTHLLNLQYSNSSDVPRYDRLQDIRNGTLRYAEWYYGPQLRELAAYELNINPTGFFNEFKTIVSYQHIEESRHQRDYRRYDRLDNRMEDLDIFGFTVDARHTGGRHELTTGIDGQLNRLKSKGIRRNLLTGAETALDSRYPNGSNRMNYFGIYAQHLFKFGGGKWVLNDGLRLQTNRLRSTIADNSFFNFPFTEIEQNTTAVTGNLGIVFNPDSSTRISATASTGFRAPNIDDGARIFESSTASRQLILPNPDIDPEYTYNFELGLMHRFADKLEVSVTGFYTLFRNAIALAPFQLNGSDSVNYNGVMSRVFANQNVNKAYIYGFQADARYSLSQSLQLYSTISYTYGRLNSFSAGKVPLDHIPPVYGKTALSWSGRRLWAEAFALYHGAKKIKDYNPFGEDNAQYAQPRGAPSWYTLNLKTSLQLHPVLSLQLGVENILDRNYRYFASGFSAPGRNWIIALRTQF